MGTDNNRWAIVLAAGEGTRLRALTTDPSGRAIPKQFCSFQHPHSMLRDAIQRAERHVPKERILTIVSPQHRKWWDSELSDLPEENVVQQPDNRGTAAGVLLPLVEILRRDPDAQVLVLPSDHFVRDETVLEKAVGTAFAAAHEVFRRVVLLGMTPDHPDPDLGWIVPLPRGKEPTSKVECFLEKPVPGIANRLFHTGGLWNTFMLASSGKTLMFLFHEILPDLLEPFLPRIFNSSRIWDPKALAAIYKHIPTYDFSKHLLERAVSRLGVLAVPPCGWSDLGTPERIRRCMVGAGENWDVDYLSKNFERPLLLPNASEIRNAI